MGSSICNNYDTAIVFDGSYDLKLAIATEMLETVDWNEETQAKARQYLYDMLMQDSALTYSNDAFLAFISEYEAVLHSQFEVSEELRNIEKYDSLYTAMINEADSLIRIYLDSIEYIYTNDLQDQYQQELEDMYYQINFLEQTKYNLTLQRQGFVDGVLEVAELLNDYVVAPELPYQNNQTLTDIYLHILEAVDTWEGVVNNHYSTLTAIANQCPAAGGKAVYRARAMLALVNDSISYNDDLACFLVGIYRESGISVIQKPEFKIIPNPANDKIEIKVLSDVEGICKIDIINLMGQIVKKMTFDCKLKSQMIDISDLSEGLYIIKLNYNEFIYNQKMIIVR